MAHSSHCVASCREDIYPCGHEKQVALLASLVLYFPAEHGAHVALRFSASRPSGHFKQSNWLCSRCAKPDGQSRHAALSSSANLCFPAGQAEHARRCLSPERPGGHFRQSSILESGCTQPDGQASHDSIVVLSLAAYAVKRPAKHTLQKSAAVSLGWPLPPPVSWPSAQ